ncbi:MAG: hypothetical protein HY849_05815 [Nitrosomonadales bacterium]|nr:hypothetical protein [Nitrosomonadales bacterium]
MTTQYEPLPQSFNVQSGGSVACEMLDSLRGERARDGRAYSLLEVEILAGLALRNAVRQIDPKQWN